MNKLAQRYYDHVPHLHHIMMGLTRVLLGDMAHRKDSPYYTWIFTIAMIVTHLLIITLLCGIVIALYQGYIYLFVS